MGMNDIFGSIKYGVATHQNEIMFTGGTICGVLTIAGTVWATVKAMKEYNSEKRERYLQVKENEESTKKEVVLATGKYWVSVTKYYLVPVGTGIASFTLFLGAFNHLKAQNASLSATLASTISSFEGYRERVKNRYGEEEEYKIYNDIHDEEHEVIVDDESGKPLYIQQKEDVAGEDTLIFTEGATGNLEFDLLSIKNIENYYNTLLESRKYSFVTKNEVIKALGGKPKGGPAFCLGAVYNPAIIHRIIIQTKVIKQNLGMDDAYKPIYNDVIACEIKGLDDDISQLI